MRAKSGLVMMVMLASAAAWAAQPAALDELPRHVALGDKLHASGQPTPETIGKLGAAGIRTVIDLRPDQETPDLDEKSVVAGAGLKYHALPISGAADLTRENVTRFDQLLGQSRDEVVLVHCASGNRVGAMMALRARWVEGRSAEESLEIGRKAGMTGLSGEVERLLQTESKEPAPH